MEDQLFYVGIHDPVELRKELLMSSKNLIDSLKRYERYKNIKEEKLSYIMELKRVFDELLVVNKKLRGKMPKTVGTPPPAKKKATGKPKHVKIKRSNIDLLEDELAKIEERLESLE